MIFLVVDLITKNVLYTGDKLNYIIVIDTVRTSQITLATQDVLNFYVTLNELNGGLKYQINVSTNREEFMINLKYKL